MNTYFYLIAAFLNYYYYKKCCKKCGNKESDIKIKKLLMISKTSKIVSKSKTIILDLKLALGVTMSSE